MTSLDTPRAKNLALILLAMTQFVIVIDASIVNVALPSIGSALHFSRTDLSWVVNAYTLTFGGFLLLGGRMADLLGRRRMFMSGLILFSVASMAGGLAQSEAWLIVARAVQGLGAALVSPAALSIITTTFAEGSERNRALGIWGAVAGAGGAAGVLLGGILSSGLGWQWVLFVNVPIGLAAAALAPRTLLESRRDGPGRVFDIPGAVTVTAGLALLVYALVEAVNDAWGSTATVLRLAGAAVLLAAFVGLELRERQPLMPFSIFRLRTLRGANIVGLLVGMSLFSMFFFISLYLQQVLRFSALQAGLSYLPLAVAIIGSAGGASLLVTRVGFKATLITGMGFVTAGLLWFSQVRAPGGSYAADVLGPSVLAGIGLGLAFVPVTIAAVTGTKPQEAGLASGLINTAQQVGGALGLAILATVANSRTQSIMHGGQHDAAIALTKGFDRAFLIGAGFALTGALLAAVLISSRDSREHARAARGGEAAAVPAPAGTAGHAATAGAWSCARCAGRSSLTPTALPSTASARRSDRCERRGDREDYGVVAGIPDQRPPLPGRGPMAGRGQPHQDLLAGRVVGKQDRQMAQGRRPGRRRGGAEAGPGVDPHVVVVAARAEEAGVVAELGKQPEAEDLAVEANRGGNAGHLQMDMADHRPFGSLLERRRVPVQGRQQVPDIEAAGGHEAVDPTVPQRSGAVGVDLDAVPVGVAQVDRLADGVVGEPLEGDPLLGDVPQPAGQFGPVGQQEREVKEAGVGRRRPRAGLLDRHHQGRGGGTDDPRAFARGAAPAGRASARRRPSSARGRRRSGERAPSSYADR